MKILDYKIFTNYYSWMNGHFRDFLICGFDYAVIEIPALHNIGQLPHIRTSRLAQNIDSIAPKI